MDADYPDPTIAAMREVWLCGQCGGENPPGRDRCAWCGCDLETVGWTEYEDEDEDEYPDDPEWTEGADFDTDEELPCLHADGCPGHRRCLVCIDRDEEEVLV